MLGTDNAIAVKTVIGNLTKNLIEKEEKAEI